MINTVLAGFEKLGRYKDFYFGIKPEALQFYQLGEGYLTLFSDVYRQTAKGHYLHCPASDPLAHSPLNLSAQRLKKNVQAGINALQHGRLPELLAAIGQQIMLAAATIAASEEGLYLVATLYNKAESFDRYRWFIDNDWSLSTGLTRWFEEATALATLLEACNTNTLKPKLRFADYQGYRLAMNRLYVMINQGFYLLNKATVDIPSFLATLHQSHLSQRWMMTQRDKRCFFEQQQWDVRQVVSVEAKEGGELCYHLDSGQLIPSPATIKPDTGKAEHALAYQLHSTSPVRSSRGSMSRRTAFEGSKKRITALE